MVRVYLKIFGGASIEGPSGPLGGRAVQRHRLGLLALLALHPRINREKVIAYLWPSASEARGRRLLSDSIYRIQRGLKRETIIAAGDDLRLNHERLPSDVAQFRAAVDAGDYARAVELYSGPFLDGFFIADADEFERWTARVRDDLAADHLRSLEALAAAAEEAGDRAAATRWWRRAAAADPLSTRFALGLMRSLARAGDRGAAIRAGQAHARMLEEELGAAPAAEVETFLREIREEPGPPVDHEPDRRRAVVSAAEMPAPRADATSPEAPGPRASEPVGDAGHSATPSLPAAPRGRRRRPSRVGTLVAAALTFVAAGLVAAFLVSSRTPAPSGPRPIAVLPFVDMGVGEEHVYVADGIAEELIGALGAVQGLRVVGRTSAFAFRDRGLGAQRIGRELGVGAIVEGSVRVFEGRLRVTARLVDVETGYHLWSETYERRMEDVLRIQDEIVHSIVATLSVRLAPGDRRAPAAPRVDAEAYNLYLRGRFLWHRRTEPELRRAAELMEEAVARAPDYARAHVGLGDAYAVIGFYDLLPPADAFSRAKAAALRALELDPTLAAAHATLGYVALYHEWDWPNAEAEFRRAVDLAPSYSTAHQWYANFLTAMGRFQEAEAAMLRAQELDPLSLIANAALGWVRYYAGDYGGAIDQCLRTLDLDPGFALAHLWLGQALERVGRLEEAEAAIREAVELTDGSAIARAAHARVVALRGDAERAGALLDDLLSADRVRYIPSYEVARVFEAVGDRAATLAWLERAFDERAHSMVFLRVDPAFESLRGDPAFDALATRVGLQPGA